MLAENLISELPLSMTGWEWHLRPADERQVIALVQKLNLPEVLARILIARGITADDAEDFLKPSLKASLPDPSHLLDMDKAAKRVAAAIQAREKIAIFGDYDVDGATSSALLTRYFRALGIDPIIYIPDRIKEGYGPNTPALLLLAAKGAKLLITVDCGTLSFEPIQAAHDAGVDVIVIDHHMGEARKPAAYAIVNPNRLDETSPHRHLAAVGVAFLLMVAISRELRSAGFFAEHAEPSLMQWLDIVALGTVCDVVPLKGLNRALVAQGLKIMAGRQNIGIRALMDIAGVDEKPGVYHAGFVVGPRINAGGRVGRSDLGVRILITEDPAEAMALAKELDLHNRERKTLEAMVLEEAMNMAEASLSSPLLVIAGKGWHQGVIGIVAGRLKERFHMPAAVIAINDGVGKASARSISGFDFGGAVIAAREAGLLLAGGGHAMAAGFSVEEAQIPALTEFLTLRLKMQMAGVVAKKRITLDAELHIAGATVELAELFEQIGPYGSGNPGLKVALKNVINIAPEPMGDGHMRTWLGDKLGGSRLSAMAFRVAGTPLAEALFSTRGRPVDIAGQLRLREWMGKRSVSLIIEDIASC